MLRLSSSLPMLAKSLMVAGILPFVAGVVLSFTAEISLLPVRAYGAVILSFMAGSYWGICLMHPDRPAARAGLIFSNVTALLGWLALLLPNVRAGLGLLLCLFIVTLHGERWLLFSHYPRWYRQARQWVTFVVSILLAMLLIHHAW